MRTRPRRVSRRQLLAVAAAAGGVLLIDGLLEASPLIRRPRPETKPADRLLTNGHPYFWAGLNYPWKSGQDFGTGGWGHSGVSNPTSYQEIDADFANMAARGVRVLKWRIFSDGRYSPEFDSNGFVTGLDDKFFPDLDAALEIASRHDMYLVLTLFASGLWTADCTAGGVRMGGRAGTLVDAAKRHSLVEKGVTPMLSHIGKSDRVLGFEIIAEPEWGIEELNHDQDGRIKVPLAAVRDFVADVTKAIHRATGALATVESNRFSNMQHWKGLGLDYYSFSWYDWLEPYEPLATAPDAAHLDRPVVLGEYPLAGDTYRLPNILDLTYEQRYAGAFGWSFWGGDGFGPWPEVAPDFADWVRNHWQDTGLGGASPPPEGPIVEQEYPYTYDGLELQADSDSVQMELAVKVASGEPYVARAYLYEAGIAQPAKEVRMGASKTQRDKLAASFSGLDEGKPYVAKLGVFSTDQRLLKWFDNLSTFALKDGQLVKPEVDAATLERNCNT